MELPIRVTRAGSKLSKRTHDAAFGAETKHDDDDKCAICLDALHSRDITTLLCGHTFHSKCMMTNVMKNNTKCPLCRQECVSSLAEKRDEPEEDSSDSDDEQDTEMLLAVAYRIQNKLTEADVRLLLSRFHIPNDISGLNWRQLCELAAEQMTMETDDEDVES
jgi:hypothetical protein